MEIPGDALRRTATAVGYGLLGTVSALAVTLALLLAVRPVQRVVYRLLYLRLGPSEATEAAILLPFVGVAAVALAVPLAVGDYLSDRLAHRDALLRATGALVALVGAFAVLAVAGLGAVPTALLVLVVGAVGVLALLRYRFGVRSGGVPALVGGVPVVLVVLLLLGFGLGWGWGYVVTATEVPSSATAAPVADFEAVPGVAAELFDADNCETTDGRRRCLMLLRGSEHELAAARFMARHGVRCPYQNAPSAGESDSFVAEHDGTRYRVTCSPHGD